MQHRCPAPRVCLTQVIGHLPIPTILPSTSQRKAFILVFLSKSDGRSTAKDKIPAQSTGCAKALRARGDKGKEGRPCPPILWQVTARPKHPMNPCLWCQSHHTSSTPQRRKAEGLWGPDGGQGHQPGALEWSTRWQVPLPFPQGR